jgi:hypothetical protein
MKMEQDGTDRVLAFKLHMPGNNPEESIPHSKHGESLKSRITRYMFTKMRETIIDNSNKCKTQKLKNKNQM